VILARKRLSRQAALIKEVIQKDISSAALPSIFHTIAKIVVVTFNNYIEKLPYMHLIDCEIRLDGGWGQPVVHGADGVRGAGGVRGAALFFISMQNQSLANRFQAVSIRGLRAGIAGFMVRKWLV
jgi:hypothetical protein